jgi:DNA-binding CsgD family transcriptional regulator
VALGACVAALMFCVLLVCGSDARLTILEVVLPLISGTSMVAVRFLGDWSGGVPTLLSNMPLGFTTAALLILAFVALRREYANGQLGLNGILEIAAMLLVYFIAVVLVWPHLTDIADSDDQHLTQRCSTLAREHNLTPRELEVLLLLAQGRRSSYISEKLCVSSGTTKTHIKRIYQKCQIHSHEQLIDLVIVDNR